MMNSRLVRCALAAVSVFGVAVVSQARADVTGYATGNDGSVYSLDLTTVTSRRLGNSGVNLVEGLAVSPAGVLYGTDSVGNLYTLSTTTGAITQSFGSTGIGTDVEGLSFQNGRLLATDFGNASTDLYSIDPATGTATFLAGIQPTAGLVRALSFAGTSTAGYLLAGQTGSESFYSVTTAGAATLISAVPTGPTGLFTSLAADSAGNLYSLDNGGSAYTVSPTGQFTSLGSTGNNAFYLDLTILPTAVPEPATAAAVGAAVILLGRRLRRPARRR